MKVKATTYYYVDLDNLEDYLDRQSKIDLSSGYSILSELVQDYSGGSIDETTVKRIIGVLNDCDGFDYDGEKIEHEITKVRPPGWS